MRISNLNWRASGGVLFLCAWTLAAQSSALPGDRKAPESEPQISYVLGPGDQITIQALKAEEISDRPVAIDANGYITLPLVGRLHVAGLTPRQVETELTARLGTYLEEPQVAVSIAEFQSQPVSVLGAVNTPGVIQLRNGKSLVEVLSMAGGLRNDAGNTLKITRRLEWGRIPLPNAKDSPDGFSVAEVSLKSVMEASNPKENIFIRPHDVISVPRGEMIYVIGAVEKSGGFILQERETVSVLQALSLAGGLNGSAAPQNAKILRAARGAPQRTESPVDVRKILASKASDVPLQPEDILFIPHNGAKKVASRAAEAAIQTATGVLIWRR